MILFGCVTLLSLSCMMLFVRSNMARVLNDYASAMEHIGNQAAVLSEDCLTSTGRKLLYIQAEDTASLLDTWLGMHRQETLAELQKNPEFRALVIRRLGQTGYTALIDTSDLSIAVHRRTDLEGLRSEDLAQRLPQWAEIMRNSSSDRIAKGYYRWPEDDGKIRSKYMVVYPLQAHSADGQHLSVAATAYLDEFSAPSLVLREALGSSVEKELSHLTRINQRAETWLLFGLVVIQLVSGAMIGSMAWRQIRAQKEMKQKNEDLADREVQHMVLIQELDMAREETEKEQRYVEQVLGSLASGLIALDMHLRITEINARAVEMFALPANKLRGQTFWGCGIDWDWALILEKIETCFTVKETQREPRIGYVQHDGKQGFIELTIDPIWNAQGEVEGVVLLLVEVSERILLELQLQQAQKLESIGQLAAGIAHEINTPIQYVGDNVRFFKDALGAIFTLFERYDALLKGVHAGAVEPQLLESVEQAAETADIAYLSTELPLAIEQTLDGVSRVSHIVRAMKDFSHPDENKKTATDLNHSIESTITVSRNEWKYVADMYTHFDPQLPQVMTLPGELNQVILNMIVNASHAIIDKLGGETGAKGEIHIGTRLVESEVEISIRDTGCGISPAIRERIFDPFFTTKEVGRGTGQGLSIAHNVIVVKHHGHIDLQTEEGQGSTFIIRLPLDES